MVETGVTALERMLRIPAGFGVIEGKAIGHTVVLHVVGSGLMDMVVLGAKLVGAERTGVVVAGE